MRLLPLDRAQEYGWRSQPSSPRLALYVRFQHNLVNETSKALPGSNLGWRFPTGLMGVKAV
jgi:hypothetical protein